MRTLANAMAKATGQTGYSQIAVMSLFSMRDAACKNKRQQTTTMKAKAMICVMTPKAA